MRTAKFFLVALTTTLLLTACEREYSTEELAADPELRAKILEECAEMGIEAKDKPNCIHAVTAHGREIPEKLKEIKKFYME